MAANHVVPTISAEDLRLLDLLIQESVSPRQIALLRIRLLLQENGVGLAATLVPILTEAVAALSFAMKNPTAKQPTLPTSLIREFRRVLTLHLHLVQQDPALAEELGRQGSHAQLTRLMKMHTIDQSEDDDLEELQDISGEIAAASRPLFPVTTNPFTVADLRARLPLVFDVGASAVPRGPEEGLAAERMITVLIHQVTSRQSAQADVGFVMWPSAVVLAGWLVTDPSLVCNDGTAVLELGAGCGLTGLVAACLQQQRRKSSPRLVDRTTEESSASSTSASVILTDFNPTVLENLKHNVALNDITDICDVVGLNFYEQTDNRAENNQWKDMQGVAHDAVDVVLGADIICQPSDAVAAANTVNTVLKPGGVAYVVCADAAHRFGVDHFAKECQRVGLQVRTRDAREIYDGLGCQNNLEQTAGYVKSMSLTLFTIRKARQ